mgnify:FL=1
MPTKKTTTDATGALRTRISELTDRIAVLENNLQRTQERVQKDMTMLQDALRDWSSKK